MVNGRATETVQVVGIGRTAVRRDSVVEPASRGSATFFHDREQLERAVARLVANIEDRPLAETVRVWVPACGTGEEVYSLAMLLVEAVGSRPVQIFGGDASGAAIDTARAGRYPLAIAEQVGAERLSRFFSRAGDGYRVRPELRDRCVFMTHDLVTHPPISRLDLVCCRDVLAHIGSELQAPMISLFHFALRQPGVLVLGRGEAIGGDDLLFEAVDAEAHVYACKPGRRMPLMFPLPERRSPARPPVPAVSERALDLDLQRDADLVLLGRYAPPSVLVDENLDILQFRGRTAPFFELPSGATQVNLLHLLRAPLVTEVQRAIQQARARGAQVHQPNLAVIPFRPMNKLARHYLIIFEPTAERRRRVATTPARHGEVKRLREDLADAKEHLAALSVEYQRTSDELGLANEKLQTANEELSSRMEELQSTKAQLQSTNEELEIINQDLDMRFREANDDVVNAFAAVEVAVVMVDTERRVRRFTPRASSILGVRTADIGRLLSDLEPRMPLPDLDEAIVNVIQTLLVHEREVTHADGTAYRMQIRPYRTADQLIAGAVVTFVDITSLRAARERASAIVEAVPTPLVVIDRSLRVRTANQAFRAAFDVAPVGRLVFELGEWRAPDLLDRIVAAFEAGQHLDELDVEFVGKLGERSLRLGTRPLPGADRGLLLLGISDHTEQRRAECATRLAAVEHDAFLDAVSHELRTPLSAILLWGQALRELPADDPGRHEAVEAIIESAQVEAQLIDDLLELALSRSGQISVALEPFDALPVIEAALALVRKDAADKHIDLDVVLPKTAPVNADPRRVRQIVTALLGNALKFTPTGGTIAIAVAIDGRGLELHVRDSGDGIPPEFLPHVFESFSQIDRSTTRTHRGLGIGLALVRHLVIRQGGTIDVASAGRGQGTTFTVRLPLPGRAST